MWSFETDPDYQHDLDWADAFVREEVEPLEHVLESAHDLHDPARQRLIPPLQQQVRERGLWATHLGPELGGPGHGQLKLALLHEILGRSYFAPVVFGCAAPDTGNAEILASFGTKQQRDRFLRPLLDGEIFSCFSMTEPQGGADPKVFKTTATLDGGDWVINGEKWFSSNARYSSFLIVVAVTDPDAQPYRQQSMFIVPADAPGVTIVRNVGIAGWDAADGDHAYIRYDNVRVPRDCLLGDRGNAFVIAQTRLGAGRIHHAMRAVGMARRAFEMMCQRAVSRYTQGSLLSEKQLVQEMIADSWLELEQFRLLVLRTAWKIDQLHDYKQVRGDISAVKAAMPRALNTVASRALQVHGSLGISNEMPFISMIVNAYHIGLADGPTEVHKVTLAREVLRDVKPDDELFPAYHLVTQRQAAIERYGDLVGRARDV